MAFSRPAAIVFLFLLPVFIFARDIQVIVEDEDLLMPLEGAVVVLRGGTQFVCDANGIARVSLPDDGQTIISITYPGYEPFRLTIPAAVSGGPSTFTVSLRLGDIMMSQELVLEAARPETSETRIGRSVAISDRELTRTAEIGIIEDVMNSVKLLPGVGYAGMFSAMPSIRGGDPGDLMAALDGFYLERPYHWMGGVSIFDPKMISSAQLSHGVFSARYGHTISGLLEVTSKTPSQTETELEAAIGSSATSLNLSLPMNNMGGILFMGKVTYWDTLVWAAQELSKTTDNEYLDMINYVTTAPFIRSAALSMNYRITADIDWRLNSFFGSDGVGADFETDYGELADDGISGAMKLEADYANYQGFLISGFTMSPSPILALRFTGGVGFNRTATEDNIDNNITAYYNDDFLELLPNDMADRLRDRTYTAPNINAGVNMESTVFNAQIRADADVDLGHGFIAAFGIQELYSLWAQNTDVNLSFLEISFENIFARDPESAEWMEGSGLFPIMYIPNAALIRSGGFNSDVSNHGLTSSIYGLVEYVTPDQRLGAELGLRVDHLYFVGKNFEIATLPALNPRLNIDYNILKDREYVNSLTATIGTGLFSSINPLLSFFDPDQFGVGGNIDIGDIEMKFNRSWTSIIGFKLDFLDKYSFNIEGYYKYIFDRGYITADTFDGITPQFNFDGIGNVWGFDLQFQKMESRYWDGWITYTFTWAKYYDPSGGDSGISMGSVDTVNDWYYPSFHRFHNCNIVLNIKPLTWLSIGIRFGFASGQPRNKVSNEVEPYPVQVIGENGMPMFDDDGEPLIIQKYRRKRLAPEDEGVERAAWALPLDVKLSFFPMNKNGKASMEIYVAGENLLSGIYSLTGRTTFNEYTGREDQGNGASSFDLPIPMVSFGFKWRY